MNSFSYRRTLPGSGTPSPPRFSGMRVKLRNGPENRSEPAPTWPPAILCPPRIPQCNAYAERFVRSIKQECLSRLVFFSEGQLHKTISIFIGHYWPSTQSPRDRKQTHRIASVPAQSGPYPMPEGTRRDVKCPESKSFRSLLVIRDFYSIDMNSLGCGTGAPTQFGP